MGYATCKKLFSGVLTSLSKKWKTVPFVSAFNSILIMFLHRSEAQQRAGRAGRTSSGKCFRIYSKDFWDTCMPEYTIPEIQRTSLTSVILTLKCLGVHDVIRYHLAASLCLYSLISFFIFYILTLSLGLFFPIMVYLDFLTLIVQRNGLSWPLWSSCISMMPLTGEVIFSHKLLPVI